jgi:hypothetical protein
MIISRWIVWALGLDELEKEVLPFARYQQGGAAEGR